MLANMVCAWPILACGGGSRSGGRNIPFSRRHQVGAYQRIHRATARCDVAPGTYISVKKLGYTAMSGWAQRATTSQ